MTIFYIVVAVLGVAIAWWVFKVLLGYNLPLEYTARAYFVQLLKKQQTDQMVPAALIDELVMDGVYRAQTLGRIGRKGKSHIRAETVRNQELHADFLRFWIRGTDAFDGPTYQATYREIFERHRVPRLART